MNRNLFDRQWYFHFQIPEIKNQTKDKYNKSEAINLALYQICDENEAKKKLTKN